VNNLFQILWIIHWQSRSHLVRASNGAWRSGTLRHHGDTTMLNKSKIALAAALILGTASAALANDSGEDRGGFVLPGSMDGVNPVYHPGIFGNADAAKAYGFVAAPRHTHRASSRANQ
jgi:hypothetical protein